MWIHLKQTNAAVGTTDDDRITEIQAAEERGEARGEVRGKIRALQSMLLRPEITDDEFSKLDEIAISTMIAQFQSHIRSRS